jgi:zinc transporter ZupT
MADTTSFLSMVLVAALSSLVSSVVPLMWYRNGIKKRTLHALLGVSAGILFALATIDLIPEGIAVSSAPVSLEESEHQRLLRAKEHVHDSAPHEHHEEASSKKRNNLDHQHAQDDQSAFGRKVTMIGVAMGFFSLVLLEHLMLSMGFEHTHSTDDDEAKLVEIGDAHSHSHAHVHSKKSDSNTGLSDSFSLTAFAAIAIHSLVDGVVIGGSFRVSSAIGARVAIAIVLHKVPDGFVVASLLAASNRSRKWVSYCLSLFTFFSLIVVMEQVWVGALSSVTPIGAVLGYALLTGISSSVLGSVLGNEWLFRVVVFVLLFLFHILLLLGFAAGTFLFIGKNLQI